MQLPSDLACRLLKEFKFEAQQVVGASAGKSLTLRGTAWRQIHGTDLGSLSGIYVPLPASASVKLDEQGSAAEVHVALAEPSTLEEAKSAVKTLAANSQIDTGEGGARASATHWIETDAAGNRFLKRQSFTSM